VRVAVSKGAASAGVVSELGEKRVSVGGRNGVEVPVGCISGAPTAADGVQEVRMTQKTKNKIKRRQGDMRAILLLLA
jgi:hypothetical protein